MEGITRVEEEEEEEEEEEAGIVFSKEKNRAGVNGRLVRVCDAASRSNIYLSFATAVYQN